MGALLIVLVFTRTPITPYILLAPLVMLQLYLFCCGLGFLLASLNVFFRDVQHIYKAITTAWMYLTPLFYPIDQLPDKLRFCVKAFNPMYYYVAQFRDLIYSGRLPGPRIFWGGWIIGIVMFIIGIIVFKKKQDKFILYI
jgi:lipopolysaccharide transport system permease protein